MSSSQVSCALSLMSSTANGMVVRLKILNRYDGVVCLLKKCVISAKKGECTQGSFSLAGTRLAHKEWHTSMPTVLDHFLICSTHNATGHCSKTCNCIVWHECFDGSIELKHSPSSSGVHISHARVSLIELSPVDWSQMKRERFKSTNFPSPSRWTLGEKTHSSKPSLAMLRPMEHAVSILQWYLCQGRT